MSQDHPHTHHNGYNHASASSSSNSHSQDHLEQQQQQQQHAGTYEDPSHLLAVYPFMTYAPTARVAEHLSPHTTTYLPSPSSSDLYPQYNEVFRKLDNPTTIEDWAMQQAAEARLREALNDARVNSYTQQLYASAHDQPSIPTSSNPWNTGQPSQPVPLPYNFLPPYPSQQPPAPAHNGQLHTPTSMNGHHLTSPPQIPAFESSPREYFNNFVNETLHRSNRQQAPAPTTGVPTVNVPAPAESSRAPAPPRTAQSTMTVQPTPTSFPGQTTQRSGSEAAQAGPSRERRTSPRRMSNTMGDMRSPQPPSSVASTPTHERIMQSSPMSSPDPLGPSPTKRSKNNYGRTGRSSSRDMSPSLNGYRTTPDMELGSLTMRDQRSSSSDQTPRARKVVEVVIPTRRKVSKEERALDDDEEEEGVDWGEDDDGDWNMDDGAYISPPTKSVALPQGSGRTGERDMRSTWERLQNLLEDIFDESDTFPSNPTSGDMAGSRFFATISKDGSIPLLSVGTIKKICSYVTRIQSARKRHTTNSDVGQWDDEVLSHILRLLERNIRDVESLVAFPEDRKAIAAESEEEGKMKKEKKSQNKEINEHDESEDVLSEKSLATHESVLSRARDGVVAAECVLVLLDSEGLSKQMYSEDLLSISVSVVKEQMEKIVFPVVEGMAGEKISSSYLSCIVQSETTYSKKGKSKALSPYFAHPALSSISASIISSIPRLTSIISKPQIAFSDSLVIQAVYLAIGPLFVNEPTVKRSKKDLASRDGGGVMKGLKMEALGCLRGTFARYEDQRQWIVEEILSSLVRIPEQNHAQNKFELTNGKSIHTISALLLQLIQASAYGTIERIRKLHAAAAEAEMMGINDTKVNLAEEETRLCTNAIDGALKSARIVAGYLVQKSTSTKATKTSHDTDYKAILDLFLRNLMLVLYRPEWPAASIYLTVFTRIFIVSLEDQKVGPETTASKGIALEYLGDIAARLKGLSLEMLGYGKIATLDEIIANVDKLGLERLINAQTAIMSFLSATSREDGSLSSSRDMASIVWAQELQSGITKAVSVVEKLSEEKGEEAQETSLKLQSVIDTFKSTLRNVWMGDEELFEIHDPKQPEIATTASIAVSRGRQLQNAIDPILMALLGILDNPAVGLRSKALRGVGSVIVVDPEVLGLPQIRQALEDRLSDPSPAVRDAAVELVGKYIVQKPKLAAEYYPHIAKRAMDTGLGVRKRVIKLLKGIFPNMESREIQVDICYKMIDLIDDQDEGVKDLAIKTLTELLYSSRQDTAGLLVDILGDFKGDQDSMERAMNAVPKECDSMNQRTRFGHTIDALINRLIDATETIDFDSLSHIRAIWLLCASDPSQIDTQKAGVLLSYLKPPSNADDQATNELLLKIFRKCTPSMPRTASTFAADLTKKLMPMISKPAGGFQALRETIGCFCAVTNHLTKDWAKLINVLRACEAKIRPIRNQVLSAGTTSAPSQAASMMLYITALIVEGCKLDNVALEDDVVDLELRKITSSSISEHFYEVYLDLSKVPSFQSAATVCVGSLFRTYPFLLQREETNGWMQDTFKSNNEDNRAQLLGVIHEFLASEVEKRANSTDGKAKKGKPQKKDMGVEMLRGDAKELQDSDYSTSIVQNNIDQIFECARSQNPPTQNAALDILTFVVNQGLYSPVHTVPILVTLETCSDSHISDRAVSVHAALHQKHASLVTVLFMESAKASYAYQRSITSEPSGHRDGIALLQSWYTLLSEKRVWRHDFLKALCRAFDSDSMGDMDPGFALYLAENLSTLEFKLQEEPMTIIVCLQKVISTATNLMSVMEKINLGDLSTDEPITGKSVDLGSTTVDHDRNGESKKDLVRLENVAKSSLIMALAVVLKNHLLDLYHLPEDKCATHMPGKKSAIGDKPASKRGSSILDLSKIPHVRGVETVGEFRVLQSSFLRLLHEDSSLAELN
ncbi:uncharacterized protein I303_100082 [Kwoniella dejecticola CBS 10117]|uniref:Sister chromatid cohesion protein n=1 Tax=Kwoniella dejecticola CBS 10117 TaxID=1296121 RepID=A0A1A6ADX3_9TREE|nr:uncharacterized protein I303_00082 [Kwoniella dejecticola CBS 10117]OBR88271.1 hypothetical protein I303_00082 [Kwoniella dejecticola CBS 10117]